MIHFAQEEGKGWEEIKVVPWHSGPCGGASVKTADVLDSCGQDSTPLPVSSSLRACSFLQRLMILFSKVLGSSTTESQLTWNYLTAWSKTVHIFQISGWNAKSKGLGLSLTWAVGTYQLCRSLLGDGFRNKLIQIWSWNSSLRKQTQIAPLKQLCFPGEAELSELTDRSSNEMQGSPRFPWHSVTCYSWKCLDEENVLTRCIK